MAYNGYAYKKNLQKKIERNSGNALIFYLKIQIKTFIIGQICGLTNLNLLFT